MKKFISSVLALTLIASVLAGCSSNTTSTSDPGSASESSTPSSQVESNTQEEQTNTEKALALIGTFASGDTETARELLDENYIQHNLAYGTGADAFIGSVEYLASADMKTTVNNIRAFEDGDYVFLQTIYNFAGAGEQVAFDIFRFDENGKIAEHWDNLTALAAEPNPSGHTQTDGTMEITDLDKTEENRKLVEDFLYDVMQGNNLDKTPDYFDGDTYIQHNTGIADGVSGLNAALGAMAEQGISMVYDEVHMVLAQGNFVLAVSEGTFGGEPTSYYDLWRVENGKIAEHWDVMETIADQSTWANDNGKF
ncbi:MAG: nuclear transport factor 2 family protein [Evtepia sp.]|nr:nuclear transport factor 2 family protein [Evtepia sp.]